MRDDVYDEYEPDPDLDVDAVLSRAADTLRGWTETVTLTGEELDLVRHLMPAHVVHQSGAVVYVRDNFRYAPAKAEARVNCA